MVAVGFFLQFFFFNNHTHTSSSRGRGTFPLKLKWWIKDKREESAEPGLCRDSQTSTSYESRAEATFFPPALTTVGPSEAPGFTRRFLSWGHGQVPPGRVSGGSGLERDFVEIRFWSSVCDLWECDGWLLPRVTWANIMRESCVHIEHWGSFLCLYYMVDVNN